MSSKPVNGRSRVLISEISPQIDGGRYPLKRILNESVTVEATLVADGDKVLAGAVAWRKLGAKSWTYVAMTEIKDGVFTAQFHFNSIGSFEYKINAWIDYALSWQAELAHKLGDESEAQLHLRDGLAHLLKLQEAGNTEVGILLKLIEVDPAAAVQKAMEPWLKEVISAQPEKSFYSESRVFPAFCDRKKALFSAWYELFPRSAGLAGHGTLKDVEKLLPRISNLGFDVLYLPPIHPIGITNRKGKNNSLKSEPGDVGSPWAIGSMEGGHKEIHPLLGDIEDYTGLINRAKEFNIEIAMDLAFQVSPDHPWVKEQPQWFKRHSDGSFKHAEDASKKHQDIYPVYFESEDWENLWDALLDIILHWVALGVKIFNVDSPHNKSIHFWEWAIAETHKKDPEVLFLAKAFTTPKLAKTLAKVGFSQSYSYFNWRNFRHELEEYMAELTAAENADSFRPNFWPSTHDILPFNLQSANESLFLMRLFMAATLSSNYGIYGPAYEELNHEAVPGKEEYQNSEKYQIKHYDWTVENKVTWMMRTVNKARKTLSSLQQTRNFRVLNLENQALFAYLKWEGEEKVVCVVNLDPYNAQEGWLQLPLDLLPLKEGGYRLHDLISGADYPWREEWNYVRLDPARPCHLFRVMM